MVQESPDILGRRLAVASYKKGVLREVQLQREKISKEVMEVCIISSLLKFEFISAAENNSALKR